MSEQRDLKLVETDAWQSGVTIRFRVIAINADGESPPSDEAEIALP